MSRKGKAGGIPENKGFTRIVGQVKHEHNCSEAEAVLLHPMAANAVNANHWASPPIS